MPCRLPFVSFIILAACSETKVSGHDDVVDTTTLGDVAPVDGDVAVPVACTVETTGLTRCASVGAVETCVAGAWQASACQAGDVCDEGACAPVVCTPGEANCVAERTRGVCNPAGTRVLREVCTFEVCVDGACATSCAAGFRRCDGQSILECGSDGSEAFVRTCDAAAGEQCAGGECLTECEVKGAKRGYLACDFWAADLPNDETSIDNVFAFAFSSGSTRPAVVTITYPWGPVEQVEVPVGGIGIHTLPVPRRLSQIPGPGIGRYGFRIQSSQPIAAFMFNPLERYDQEDATAVATNDASLLIPATALGKRYLAITWSDLGQFSRPPYVTVVATKDDTQLVVRPTTTITMAQRPYIARAGEETSVTLQAFETLNLETPSGPGSRRDLTGTSVVSLNHPVAVFAGNRCARVPDSARFCDHLETQLPPLETWGDRFVVTKFTDRGGESDYFRVLAQEGGTELVFDPPRAAPILVEGEMFEFDSKVDFTLTSSKPVLLAQFMASQSMTKAPGPFGISRDCPPEFQGTCQGDPSLVLAAPVAQWRNDAIFLVPDTYAHQFINLAFTAGTELTLDGQRIDTSGASSIGAGDWRSLVVATTGGYRSLAASRPVGVVVYGYDHNISFAYNAGLDFKALAP